MGNSLDSSTKNIIKKQENIIQKLQPYDQVVTEQFGPIKIYRINEKISRYYFQYREMGVLVDKTRQKFEERMNKYKEFKDHKNIVAIEGIQLIESNQMCIKKIYLEIYARYYNFSLQMALELKRKRCIRFRDGDLFYIFSCLFSIVKETNQYFKDKYSAWFTLNNIFIAPQGLIKLYLFPLNDQSPPIRSSHKYSRSYLDNQQCIISSAPKIYQPQQQIIHDNNQHSPSKHTKKTRKNDIRDIGILLYRLIMIQKQAQNLQIEPIEKIQYKLSQFSIEQGLNKKLKQLTLLLIKGYQNTTIQQIDNLYQSFKRDEYEERIYVTNSIKLEEGQKLQQSNTNSKLSIGDNLRGSKAITLTIGSRDRNSFIKK